MPLYEDVARAIVRKRKAELQGLSPEDRTTVLTGLVEKLRSRSDDELIQYLSARPGGVSPEAQGRIDELQQVQARVQRPGRAAAGIKAQRTPIAGAERTAELQQIGVSTDEPLPAGSLEVGFAEDPAEGLKSALSEHFGKDVTVFRRKDDILYLDPTDDVIKRANPNLLGVVGKGLPITGDVLGTVGGGAAGAVVTKHPAGLVAGEAIGSAVGTTFGEAARLTLGNILGVNDLSIEEIAAKASKEGAKAGAITVATGGVTAGVKGLKNFFKGGVFTQEEALRHGLTTEQADAAIAEVNKILKDADVPQEVKATLFQRTRPEVSGELGGAEARVRTRPESIVQFQTRAAEDQAAVKAAIDVVTQPGEAKGGAAAREIIAGRTGARVEQAKAVVAKNATELDKQLKQLSGTRKEAVGEPTRNIIAEKRELADKAVDATWESVRKTGGFKPQQQKYGIEIPLGQNTKQRMALEARRRKSAVTTTRQIKLLRKPGKNPDLEDFNNELSTLKAELRAAKRNKQYGTPQIRDMQKAIAAMEKDRHIALFKAGREDLIKAIKDAELKTQAFYDTYDRSLVGDLLAKDERGVFKVASPEFVDRVLKGDRTEASQLVNVIADQPTLMQHWKEGLADAYTRKAFPDGKFSRRTSNEFLESNDAVLREFFSSAELAQIKKTGNLAQVVKKQQAQLKEIIKKADKQWGSGKLKSLDPDNVVKFLTNDSGGFIRPSGQPVQASVNKINFVKGNLQRNHPGAWRKVQEEYSTSLRQRIIDPASGNVKPKQLADMLEKDAHQIKAMMGEQYHKDLAAVSKVVQIINRKPKPLSEITDTAKGLKQVIRIGAAPLTARGRAFTAVDVFRTKAARDVIAKAMLNPTTMRDVAKLAEHNTLTRETAELAASIGLLDVTGED